LNPLLKADSFIPKLQLQFA